MWWKYAENITNDSLPEETENNVDIPNVDNASVGIIDDADPLMKDARQYTDANEFIENQQGLVLYHGTNNEFDIQNIKTNNESYVNFGLLGNVSVNRHGIFFSDNKEFSKQFGENILTCHVVINNPAHMSDALINSFVDTIDPWKERELWIEAKNARHDWQYFDEGLGERFVQWLKSEGYDGAVFEEETELDNGDWATGNTYVVFDPSQVKTIDQLNNIWTESKKPYQYKMNLNARANMWWTKEAQQNIAEIEAIPNAKQPLTFHVENVAAYSGQTNHVLRAKTVDGTDVGYLEYAVYQGEPSICMIKVPENMRRKGYGKALMHKLQDMFPDKEINLGMSSQDGQGLIDSLNIQEFPTKDSKTFDNYEKLIHEKARLQAIADEFYETKDHSPEEQAAFDRDMQRFNDIDNRIYVVEQGLWNKKPTKRLIPTDSVTGYHGTDTEPEQGQRSGYYPGTYTSVNLEDTSEYGKNVFSTLIDSGRIYKFRDYKDGELLKEEARKHGFGYHSGNGYAEVEFLKSKGYIGLQRGTEIILFDKAEWRKH